MQVQIGWLLLKKVPGSALGGTLGLRACEAWAWKSKQGWEESERQGGGKVQVVEAAQAREGTSRVHSNPACPRGTHTLWAFGQRGTEVIWGPRDSIFPATTVIKAAFSSPHYAVFTILPEKQKPAQHAPPHLSGKGVGLVFECRERTS